jgi:hypothetical protein
MKKSKIDPTLLNFKSEFKKVNSKDDIKESEKPNKSKSNTNANTNANTKKLSKLESLESTKTRTPYKRKTKEELLKIKEEQLKRDEEKLKREEEELKRKKEELKKEEEKKFREANLFNPMAFTKITKDIDDKYEEQKKIPKISNKIERKNLSENDIDLDNLNDIEIYKNTNFCFVLIKKLVNISNNFIDDIKKYQEIMLEIITEDDEINILNFLLEEERKKEFPILNEKMYLITIINTLYNLFILSYSTIEEWIKELNLSERKVLVRLYELLSELELQTSESESELDDL